MDRIKHVAFVLAVLFVVLGIPTLFSVDVAALLAPDGADAVTRASLELPEQPSGEFLVLLNTDKHRDTLEQWRLFFSGEDAGVIMSDISCMVIDGDATGLQLAERYQARLPENQMTVKQENGLLLASKAEAGRFDTIILSREAAESYGVSVRSGEIEIIPVKGE